MGCIAALLVHGEDCFDIPEADGQQASPTMNDADFRVTGRRSVADIDSEICIEKTRIMFYEII